MKLNIARQPLIPALLTLAAITALTMWKAPAPTACTAENLSIPTFGELAIPSVEELLCRFQAANPVWAKWIAGFLTLFTGLILGRLTLRYNLYSAGTCLAIPLFGIFVAGLLTGSDGLSTLTATTLLALAVRNYSRSFCNGYGFDAIFRASFYLGLMTLAAPSSLPLVGMLLLAVVLFHRTLREAVVAIAGMLLPILTFCYVNWGAGGDFLTPFTLASDAFLHGSPLDAVRSIPLKHLVALVAILLLDLAALVYFLGDSYATGNKPRAIFIFQIGLLVLLVPTMLNPVSTTADLTFMAVPSAVIVPFLLVRIHRLPNLILYLLLLGGSVAILFLQ